MTYPLPCGACFFPLSECVCPYFHEFRMWSTRYVCNIDHSRPNPFPETAP